MFWKKREPDPLDAVIDAAIKDLMATASPSEAFQKKVDSLSKLLEVADARKGRNRVKPDTLATIGANLLGILMIIKHESVAPLVSKALSFIIKPKI